MPRIRYHKAYKLKPGKTKLQGRTYVIQPIKKPRNLPAGSGLLIPSKGDNPGSKLSIKDSGHRSTYSDYYKKKKGDPMARKRRRRKRRRLPPRDPRTGRFRKRKKRKKKRGRKRKKKRGNPNNCRRMYRTHEYSGF